MIAWVKSSFGSESYSVSSRKWPSDLRQASKWYNKCIGLTCSFMETREAIYLEISPQRVSMAVLILEKYCHLIVEQVNIL